MARARGRDRQPLDSPRARSPRWRSPGGCGASTSASCSSSRCLQSAWEEYRPEGIYLSLPVTHELLGRIVGARRQSVTTALGDLRARGIITALTEGKWLLAGPADPAALLAHSRATVPRTQTLP